MAEIFVSYSSKDRDKVALLVGHLEAAGYSLWWDKQLQGGAMFSRKIEEEVEKSDIVLVVWSAASLESRWVADETELALQTGKLVPIKLDGVSPPMGFRQIQTIDFAGWDGLSRDMAVETLIATIEHHLSGVRTSGKSGATKGRAADSSDASIAVLPFVNMSSDPEQDYFSDGIAEELLNLLAKIKQLRVIARTSSFAFKGADKQVSEIGELLDVAHIIEGSVRKAGNRVRITAQLIETLTSSHLWSETYDRTLDDIFAVQDEISAAIVDAMKEFILGDIEAPQAERSSNIVAYDHYLSGNQLRIGRTRAGLEKSRTHFESALELDPDYAPALIGLADAHLLLSNSPGCYGDTPIVEARAAALPLLKRAKELEPESDDACCVMALYYQNLDHEKAIASAQEALTYNPNSARAFMYLSFAFIESGDPNAPSVSTLRRALELDPVSMVAMHNLANNLLERAQREEAETIFSKMKVIDPTSHMVRNVEVYMALESGHLSEALSRVFSSEEALGNSNALIVALEVLADLGETDVIVNTKRPFGLRLLAERGLADEAAALRKSLAQDDLENLNYLDTLGMAYLAVRNGEYAEALALLRPFEETDPDKWGPLFGIDEFFLGARLSFYARRRLGKTASASLYLTKLREIYQTFQMDPDGAHFTKHFLGAILAVADGDMDGALDLLEEQVAKTMHFVTHLLQDPILEVLHDQPRYQALCARVDAHFASERKTAEAAGLLPVPQNILDRLNL